MVPLGNANSFKDRAIYDQECLESVHDPKELYLYGIPMSLRAERELSCFFCGKPLPTTIDTIQKGTSMSVTRDALQLQINTMYSGVLQLQTCYQAGNGNIALARSPLGYILLFFDNNDGVIETFIGRNEEDAQRFIQLVARVAGAQLLDA